MILSKAEEFTARGLNTQLLTVDNAADGAYLYLALKKKDPERAERVRQLLEWNGGGANSSGVGIGCVNNQGWVYPDQFWHSRPLGNVKEKKFSQIWSQTGNEFLDKLRDRVPHLKGKCSTCGFVSLCGGGLRSRAEMSLGDTWAADPACYLTDEERIPRAMSSASMNLEGSPRSMSIRN